MNKNEEVLRQATLLPYSERAAILTQMPEVQLHRALKELFIQMEPDYLVEVTHGANEQGKDLVLVKRDRLSVDVIAVIVKCGDVTGKTVGEVDGIKDRVKEVLSSRSEKTVREVLSQIDQAQNSAAELRSVFERLPVNKLFIVLAGLMSDQARRRIESEVKEKGPIWDIDVLVGHFTNHYPQVFFEGRAIDFLQSKIQELDCVSSVIRGSRTLSDYWVEPLVAPFSSPINVDLETLVLNLKRKKIPISRLKSVTTQEKRVILAGDPGTGKSAALAKLAINSLRETYRKATTLHKERATLEVPVFVTAADLNKSENYSALLNSYFGEAEVRERFQVSDLFVDGLDEVPSARRPDVVAKAKQFADLIGCSLLITSRKIDLINQTHEGFSKYELMPFEIGQAVKLFEKLLAGDDAKVKALKDGLNRIRHQIPIIPLSLVLMMELVEKYNEVPSTVTELYDRFMDAVLGREDERKGIEVLFEYLVKKRFLAALAYEEFLRKDRLEIPYTEFESFCVAYSEKYGLDVSQMERFRLEIDRAGVIRFEDRVEFAHRSFLDYFTAFHLYDQRDELEEIEDLTGYIAQLYFDGLWQDVAFFYVGLKRTIPLPMLNRILDYTPHNAAQTSMLTSGAEGSELSLPAEEENRDEARTRLREEMTICGDKLLVGRLLQAGWNSATHIKASGIRRAFQEAPLMRDKLLEMGNHTEVKLPPILADYIVMVASDFSFRSSFLQKELRAYFDEIILAPTDQTARILPSLLWTMRSFLSTDEMSLCLDQSVKIISAPGRLQPEIEAGAILLLNDLKTGNDATSRALDKRINRLRQNSPEMLRSILPTKRIGGRKLPRIPKS